MTGHAQGTRGPEARGERGMALVVAMLVLLVLSMLAMVLMASVAVNRQVAGIDMYRRKALDNADAGVAEALMRIRNRDVGMSLANPRSTAQIYLATTGSIPVVGVDTVAMATAQPVGTWMNYSTAAKTPDVLTVTYKTNAARTGVYRYDPTANPKIHFGGTGYPIYEITSTGTSGMARRTIITDVVAKPISVNAKGAVCVGRDVDILNGNSTICGYNHSSDTQPVGSAGDNGRGSAPDCQPWEVANPLPAVWAAGAVGGTGSGNSETQSPLTPKNVSGGTGFYAGPWEMLGMTQPEFSDFIGAPVASQANINGLVYIDNDAIMGNQSDSGGGNGAAYHNVTGEGMLYVDGDLTLNAGFTYTGLVYVEGDLHSSGSVWILGGLVVKGIAKVAINGNTTILYSSDAINQELSKYAGQFMTLSWREKL
jgi:Tfp pilus assembly protein PilX